MKIIWSVVVFLLAVSCSEYHEDWESWDEEFEVYSEQELFPFSERHSWEYKDKIISTGDEFTTILESQGATIIIAGAKKDTVYPVQWVQSQDSAQYDFSLFFQVKKQGLWIAGGATATDTVWSSSLYLKYPVAQGDKWPVVRIDYNVSTGQPHVLDTVWIECTGIAVQVSNKQAQYQSIEYSYSYLGEKQFLYYAPGLGFVAYKKYKDSVLVSEKFLQTTTIVVQSEEL
jgi:hypothetical protein